ncbi:tetraspanin-11 isoform X2 [Cavia porcellus]|nr:tetraspanin-11 isoform X2 [Cavia porcellus]
MHGGMSRAPRQLQKSPLNSAAAAGRCGLGAALPRPIPPRQAGRGAARGRWAVSAQPQPQAQPQPSVPGSGSLLLAVPAGLVIMAHFKSEQDDWLVVYLKYLLFVFNFFFWAGGAAVMAVGVWTLTEKSGYLGVLASSTFAASAYILISAGTLVMVTGFLGCGAILREQRGCLSMYFCLLFVIFLVELVAGVLAHVYYQRLSDELKQHLNRTLAENYGQPRAAEITASVDRLQQDFKCCGSNGSADWQHSAYIQSQEAQGRRVPDSCCKTVVARCGQRVHPSNIYKVEGGCITKLEQFLADHLLLMGAVGIGVACMQICGMILTCCLHQRLQRHFY